MIHDDDESRPLHYEIHSEDFSNPAEKPASLPAQDVQQQIVDLAQQPGWTADDVHAHFRRSRHDISLAAIQYVLAQINTQRQR